jgi:hypothetical protein
MVDYAVRRRDATRKLFEGFQPNVSNCRIPEQVLEVARLAAEGLFSHEIGPCVGLSAKAVQKIYRRYGFPTLYNFCPPQQEQRVGWAGGEKIVKGYVYCRSPGHPNASRHGDYVAVHRLVMEEKIGRYLSRKEVVHHVDGNPANNDVSNLELFASNAAHLGETLSGKCPKWTEEGLSRLARARSQPRRMWKGQPRLPNPSE